MTTAKKLLNESADFERLKEDKVGFGKLADLLKQHAGINLVHTEKNMTLMASRLVHIMNQSKLSTYDQYLAQIRSGGPEALEEYISQLTTNTTEFFRESQHFPILQDFLTKHAQAKRGAGSTGELRAWCAACSSGQEAYSILMTVMEIMPDRNDLNLRFLATDIDQEILEKASRGQYRETELGGIPPLYQQKYFSRVNGTGPNANTVQVKKQYRDLIRFAQMNLISKPYPFQHQFDFAFCRNVLIYFDRATAEDVTLRIGKSLKIGGLLFVGHSESGILRSPDFETVAPAVYRRIK